MAPNRNTDSLPADNNDPETILLLVDSTEAQHRIYALEVLGTLLDTIYENPEPAPDTAVDVSLKAPISFAILTRCDDILPAVRTKALTVLFQTAEHIVKFLDETKEQATFECEDLEDLSVLNLDVNGNHRYFWYLLRSFKERRKELTAVLHRRIEDSVIAVRKAALLATTSFMIVDCTFIDITYLKCLESVRKDNNGSLRKLLLQSLSVLLEIYDDNSQIQELWLKCTLPLVDDLERSVQSKALSLLEGLFLKKMFSSVEADNAFSMDLLKMLSSGDFLAYHGFFKKAFCIWKWKDKLKSEALIQLVKYVGTESEKSVWFYVSYFVLYSEIPKVFSELCIEHLENLKNTGEYPSFMEHVMRVLVHTYQSLPVETLDTVQSITSDGLEMQCVPVELIPVYIEILSKIHQIKGTLSEFSLFSSVVMQKCQECFSEFQTQDTSEQNLSEELITKCLCTMTELCQIFPSHVPPTAKSILRSFCDCIGLPATLHNTLSPSVKAHVFVALGKISLQDETLAKELCGMFVKELIMSGSDVLRSNAVVILTEMCKRYTPFADKCVPLIIWCLKDKLHLIRYQTIVLLANLLQGGHIRWQLPLFFGLLSTLTDEKEVIRQTAHYCISEFLPEQKDHLFFDCFIDSIFVFNCFSPPDNESIAQNVKHLERFAIVGEINRKERMLLYKFLLESMSLKQRAYLIKPISDVLTNVADSVYSLDKRAECLIRDCFAILTCNEIRTLNLEYTDADEAVERDINETEKYIRRVVIVEPLIPVLSNLKNFLVEAESELMYDMILFLKSFLSDFKNELTEILVLDKVLMKQLELEFKNDAERERRRKIRQKEILQGKKYQSAKDCSSTTELQGIQNLMKNTRICLRSDNITRKRTKTGESSSNRTKVPRLKRTCEKQLTSSTSYETNIDQPSTSTGIY